MKKTAGVAFLALTTCLAFGQTSPDTPEAHREAARAAAGRDLLGVFNTACPDTSAVPAQRQPAPGRGAGAAQRQDPPRDQWYMEPVKVFDNLYYVGTKIHGAWAVTTSDGIIIVDALYNYAAEPEITEGLKKLGLDPAQIKYVVITHAHGDHDGGAKYLQDAFSPHLLMSAADWDLAERDTRNPKPRRDLVATDGQKLTLGDTTITLYITPGHTLGTLSLLVPVKDGGQPHLAAEWGGTAISTSTPVEQLRSYIRSAARFRDIAVGSRADVIITNHTAFDGALTKLASEQSRKPGQPNPYVVGNDTVKRYLTVAEECGKAVLGTVAGAAH